MKFLYTLFAALFLTSFTPGMAQSTQSKHREMHTQLLANAKNSIDKSVIQDYLKVDIDRREAVDPLYEGLSEESIAMIGDLLAEAKTHTGQRYRSGGKGPTSFDCSGFTGYVYRQFGFKLNASSSAQYNNGIAVENGSLRPGDLVFFTSPRSRGGVGHVGIVVEADNDHKTFTFIHAAVGGGIEIQKSTAPYYQKRYVGARRIITE